MKINQGDIVLVPFPFSDLSSQKTRPALVISNKLLKSNDVILCAITSQKIPNNELVITNKDLARGKLPVTSYIKIGKLVGLEKNIIQRVVAKIKKKKLEETLRAVCGLLYPN